MFQKIGLLLLILNFLATPSFSSIKKPEIKSVTPNKNDTRAARYFAQLISKIKNDEYDKKLIQNIKKNDRNKIFKIYKDQFSFLIKLKKEKSTNGLVNKCDKYIKTTAKKDFRSMLNKNITSLCHNKITKNILKNASSLKEKNIESYFIENLIYLSSNNSKQLISIAEKIKEKTPNYYQQLSVKLYSKYIESNYKPSFDILSKLPQNKEFSEYFQKQEINKKQKVKLFTRELYKIYKEIKEKINQPKIVTSRVNDYIQFMLINKKHINFDRAIRQAEILTRYLAPKGYKAQNSKLLNTFRKLSAKNSEYEHRMLFHHIWASLINDNFTDAHDFIKREKLITRFDSLDSRLKFWIPYVLKKNKNSKNAIELYRRFIESDNIGYYTILAKKELNLIESNSLKPNFKNRNLSSDIRFSKYEKQSIKRVLTWLEIGYQSFAKKEMNQLISGVHNSVKSRYLFKISEIFNKHDHYLFTFKTLYNALNNNTISYDGNTVEKLFPMAFFKEIKKQSNNLDPIVIISLIRQESAFNPDAKSHVGARGLMQLMPNTARQYIKGLKAKQLRKPKLNIKLGVKYLSRLLNLYEGNLIHSLAAYNAGEGRVKKWKKTLFKSSDPLINVEAIPFEETQKYVKLIYRNIYFYKYILNQDIKISSIEETFFTAYN